VGLIEGGKREVLYTHTLRKGVCVVRVCQEQHRGENEGTKEHFWLLIIDMKNKVFHDITPGKQANERERGERKTRDIGSLDAWMLRFLCSWVRVCMWDRGGRLG